jgi:hypothetical protein
MSKTNFEKLVRWDADYYKSLTDDDCIVCLTEREVYIIGQITDMLRWKRTRWIGDILGLDFDLIASNLEYKLSERMTCQNITTLLQKITQLEAKIDYVFNETVVNEGDTVYDPETTVMDDVFTPEQMQTGDMAVQAETCDEDGKHQIYGAVSQLVRYIVGKNTDLLQQFEQGVGNLAEQAETLLSAFPPTDLLAVDEVAKYTAFLTQELQEEYEATVDEELIQEVICDIFCIAVANNCRLTMWDVYNYFGSKVDPTFSNAALTYANLVGFAFTGTFSGDMYFHYLCYFQLASAAFSGVATGDGLKDYELQIAAGFNSPDADWMLFCTDCPQLYRKYTVDFAFGLAEWTIDTGTLESGRMRGADGGSVCTIELNWNDFDPAWEIRAMKVFLERIGGTSSSSDQTVLKAREIANSNTSSRDYQNSNGQPNGLLEPCGSLGLSPAYDSNFVQLMVFARVHDPSDVSEIYISKIEILFSVLNAPERAIITDDGDLCT